MFKLQNIFLQKHNLLIEIICRSGRNQFYNLQFAKFKLTGSIIDELKSGTPKTPHMTI